MTTKLILKTNNGEQKIYLNREISKQQLKKAGALQIHVGGDWYARSWVLDEIKKMGFSVSETPQANQDIADWHEHQATSRQREYLAILQVRIPEDYPLTKGSASAIIESVKSGNGVGQFGLFFTDGSN